MYRHQEIVLRTDAEARITRETLRRAEALLEHFDSALYPICQMQGTSVRTLHRRLNAFVEQLDSLLSAYPSR